jgi:biotin synthase
MKLNIASIEQWLRTDDEHQLQELWYEADKVRQEEVGAEVHLRGLIEISNYCSRNCGYCGINVSNLKITRYRMAKAEIIECAHLAKKFGYGTVVLQSGEDYGITRKEIEEIIKQIKNETALAVTLSLGERSFADMVAFKKAGADRYLIRFETSDKNLFQKIHPSLKNSTSDRIKILNELRALGYEIGSGVMIGIPGQRYLSLAEDINLFRELDLDMIGVGPYILHPETELARECQQTPIADQVPNSELMTYKVIALARLVCPRANIPSTTALATLNRKNGREFGLSRGANIIMPNLTPLKYRSYYEIYPNKACLFENAEDCNCCIKNRIQRMGRKIGVGKGGRVRSIVYLNTSV